MKHVTRLVILVALGIAVILLCDRTKPHRLPIVKVIKAFSLDSESVRFLKWYEPITDGNRIKQRVKFKIKEASSHYETYELMFTVENNEIIDIEK